MAAPTVRGFAAATNTTDALPAVSITLPTRAAGDLLIAFAAGDSATAFTHTETTNWAEIRDVAGTGANRLAVYARIATNNATDALTIAGANTADASFNVVAITAGTHGVVTPSTDIIVPVAATGTTGNANPPSANGIDSKDWLAIAIAAVDLTATGSTISGAPTNYSTGAIFQKSASSTSSVALGVGYRALTAATTEDPGTFTNTSGAWIAQTLLIPPPLTGLLSARFNSAGDRLTRAATGLGSTAVTMMTQVKFATLSSGWQYYMGADNASSYALLGMTNANNLHYSASGGSIDPPSGNAASANVWYTIAVVYNPSGTDTLYWKPAGGSWSSYSAAAGGITDSWTFQLGANGWAEWADCYLAGVKIWTAALSQAEVEEDGLYYAPQRTADLWAWFPFDEGYDLNDYSGNNRHLTAAGGSTVTSAAGPAIEWDSSGALAGEVIGAMSWVGSTTGRRTSSGASTGSNAWVGSITGKKIQNGSASGAISWVGNTTGVRAARGASTGAISWVGNTTGAKTSNGASTGVISWVGSTIGTRVSNGAASGTIAWVGVVIGGNLGFVIGSFGWVGTVDGVSPTISANEGEATGAISWLGSATGVRAPKGATTGAISWVGSSTGAKLTNGSASGAISWVGSATGVRTPKGASTGSISWIGSITGARTSSGASTGSNAWVGSVTGTRVSSGSTAGSISWVGSSTGARTSSGASTGTISWVGVVIGGNLGVIIGSIGWAGTTTGAKLSSGNASGAIDWIGSVIGFAPTVGINDGQCLGSINWVGSATGVTILNGSSSGFISWVGVVEGDAPAVGMNDGEVNGSVIWSGTANGIKASSGSINGATTWVGIVLGAELGVVIGSISWVGTVEGFAETLPTQEGNVIGTITWAGTAIGSTQRTGEVFGLIVYMGVVLGLVTADPTKFLLSPHARGYAASITRGYSSSNIANGRSSSVVRGGRFTEIVTGHKSGIVQGRSRE